MGHLFIPSFRWWDGDKIPTHDKLPLLRLKLSSHSFLDSSLEDDLSATTIYTIKTTQASTAVLRYGNERNPTGIATIKWPTVTSANKDPPLIKMRDWFHWSKGSVFLRSRSTPNSSRKFAIPDYSYTMKWKRYGNSYWCTTSSIKGPIAILDLANAQEHMSLTIFETLRDKNDPQALPSYRGVTFLLLDYLIVTALLCVTDVSAWMKLSNIAPWNDVHSGQGMPTSDASCSRWYTDTPTIEDPPSTEDVPAIEDSSKDYLATKLTRTIPPVFSLLSQLARPSLGTSSTSSSPKPEISPTPDQPTTSSIHSLQPSQQSPLEALLSSEQPPNVSISSHTPSRSISSRRPLPKPPRESVLRRTQSSVPLPIDATGTSTGAYRSLPPTPLVEVLVPNEGSSPSSPSSSHSRVRFRSPPMTKASQEDLNQWVHGLTDAQRNLPRTPLPETVVFDMPPPSYCSIYYTQGSTKRNYIPTSTSTPPST